MSGKFSKKLKRELTANPKKAVSLGLLLLVAVWFWAPLFSKWFGGDKKPAVVIAPTATGTPDDAAAAVTTPAAPTALVVNWKQAAAWIDGDRLMKPVAAIDLPRNPFGLTAEPVVDVTEREAAVRQATAPRAPEELGLTLSSTIVGSRGKSALISGRVYPQGSKVVAGESGQSYTLVEVGSRHVVLALNGQTYLLSIPNVKVDGDGQTP